MEVGDGGQSVRLVCFVLLVFIFKEGVTKIAVLGF